MSSMLTDGQRVWALQRVETARDEGTISAEAAANVTRWLTEPHYGKYVQRVFQLVEAGDFAEVERLFWQQIPFGTGGRRGTMAEFGSATINERTIAESAHGLAAYWQSQNAGEAGRGVVAYDTRNRSDEFARITACVLAGHGFQVFLFEAPRSTPELSFAVRHLDCHVGVMITASHNPPEDNGFKAYWTHGGQVLDPHDKGIIEQVEAAKEIPQAEYDDAVADGRIELVGEAVDEAYLGEVAALSLSDARDVPALYTPLHGVGTTCCQAIVERLGFTGVELFGPQKDPDGNFTNVPQHQPNPEQTFAFEPALDHAQTTGAELVLASDPDADRLGVCVKGSDGEFAHLTGNQVGALLVDYVLRKRKADLTPEHYVVETLVTTPLVAAIGRKHGVRVVDDLLVGFKYVARTMEELGAERFVFGTEESLGYLAGTYARDKDAAIPTMYVLELAAELRRGEEPQTLLDRLQELYAEHGYFVEGQRSRFCEGSEGQQQIAKLLEALRTSPPTELAGERLARVRDYGRLEVRDLPGNAVCEELEQPQGELLFFETEPGERTFRIAARPSGTEPKIKFYFFGEAACEDAARLAEVKEQTDRRFGELQDALDSWVERTLAAG